jgi:predicted MFS family arabinose efflux permease
MDTAPPRATTPVVASERLIIFLVGAIQFINVLDFMMVMPLGPSYARALGISTAHIGLIAGSYTAAAAVAGIVAARFLDRFDRRKALGIALFGLVIGTAAGAFAQGLTSLVCARAVAGAFGGPATSLSLSIIADVVPPARRGRAMGAVMGAFSVASVFGVYSALELATYGGWRLPFIVVAALGVVVVILALWAMPPMRGHIVVGTPERVPEPSRDGLAQAEPALPHAIVASRSNGLQLSALLRDGTIRLALVMNGLVMLTAFLVVPNIAPHLLQNLGFPFTGLRWGYMIGGASSFLIMRVAGHAIDRYGAARVAGVGTAVMIGVLYFAFIAPGPIGFGGVMLVFVLFMAGMSVRNVSMSSLSTRVPRADQRAGYMSLQSTAQHISSATGAFASSRLLHEAPGGRLAGISTVAAISAVLALGLPPMLAAIGKRVSAREAS